MRLRYIYLRDYGPLKEVAVVFQQNEHIENRTGAINFVVGLNGSGKSSLLRAIYDIFHSLSQEELPKFPVTLAYDIYDKTYRTVIFHRPRGAASESVIWSAHECLSFATAEEWQDHIEYLSSAMMANPEFIGDYVLGDRLKGDGNLRTWLPARVLAYTSGDLKPWQSMAYPVYPADELKDDPDDFNRNQERPCGWTADQERAYRRGDFGSDDKLSMGETEPVGMEGRCMLLTAKDVQLAALSLGLWQAAMELDEQREESQQEVFRKKTVGAVGYPITCDRCQTSTQRTRLASPYACQFPVQRSRHANLASRRSRYLLASCTGGYRSPVSHGRKSVCRNSWQSSTSETGGTHRR